MYRLQTPGGALSESFQKLPGATNDALTPFSVAERSLAAGPAQWFYLVAVALAAAFADQLTKHVVASALALDESVHVLGPSRSTTSRTPESHSACSRARP